jgi:uncharacterized cofD-like protein
MKKKKKYGGSGRDKALFAQLGWLTPGLGVKRWLGPILLGTSLIGVGLAVIILDFYRNAPDAWWLPIVSAISLREFTRPVRALIFGLLGLALILWGVGGLNRSLMAPYRRPGHGVLDELSQHRRLERGPKIVAIGGGHGLAVLLRGLKKYTNNLTAVVTVADDGGSSGRLRRSAGMLPPGDIRNCLAALSNDETLLSQLFQYRFASGMTGLEGHSFGNLFIYALSEITGSFEEAVAESGKVLSVHGRVLPATLHDVKLVADVSAPFSASEVRVEGESSIPEFPGKVNRVWLEPNNPPTYPKVVQALLGADLIVVGPGSLFTSILPNLLVPDLVAAMGASRALKIYVCNLTTQPGETNGYSCNDHIQVIIDHAGEGLFDIVLVNSRQEAALPEGYEWVCVDENLSSQYALHSTDLVNDDAPTRHDGEKLSKVLMDLLQERTGPLVE